MGVISREFLNSPTPQLARALLGCELVHETPAGTAAGVIVETEAYLFEGDLACHASRGVTERNQVMFQEAGRSYVYLIYGMYFCFNVVSGAVGRGEAVLIRALEPSQGIGLMGERRGTSNLKQLCSGPGKLCQALAITREQNNHSLLSGSLRLESHAQVVPDSLVATGTRIGISVAKELPLRFGVSTSPFLSKPFS